MKSSGSGMSTFGLVGVVGGGLLSWLTNQSIGWGLLHAVLGWLYILYRAFGCGGPWPGN